MQKRLERRQGAYEATGRWSAEACEPVWTGQELQVRIPGGLEQPGGDAGARSRWTRAKSGKPPPLPPPPRSRAAAAASFPPL
jgi:hypothetical protein